MIELSMPIYWYKSKRKRVLLSLNAFRNWHHTVASKFKREMHELATSLAKGQEAIKGSYILEIDMYYERANCDGSNVVPMIEKAVLDALVTAGLLEGDSVKLHKGTLWEVMGPDKENPRCDIRVIGVNE